MDKKGNKNSTAKKNGNQRYDKRSSSRRIIEEVTGRVALSREGYGFIILPDKNEDIYVPARKLRGALNNDTVLVAITRKAREQEKNGNTRASKFDKMAQKSEGEVLEILQRSEKPHIGILQIIGNQAWVIVESRFMPYDIEVLDSTINKDMQGMKVAVLVTGWKKGESNPVGKIVDVLGVPGENNTEMHAILAEFGLPYKFPKEVEEAAAKIPTEIDEQEIKIRKDFRKTLTMTIDPADAKDFDDAISFKKLENGNFEIGVHIADVSHYVRPGDIVDVQAVERGTSVYLVDRTIPMLPEVLSNNLCSLRPNEDKLCYSAVFEMNEKAKVINSWFGKTVIRSDRRFAYEQAQEIIESKGEDIIDLETDPNSGLLKTTVRKIFARKKSDQLYSDKEVAISVLVLHDLASKLRSKRFESGSISFERPEMKVVVDKNGKPIDVIQKITKEANWLVEEFMLLANKEVATFISTKLRIKEPTFVYRIHDEPDFDKIQNLRDFVKHFGYAMGPTTNAREVANELNKLLGSTKGKPESSAIEIIALRSMARARYSTDNVGHYGLGFDYYTHFTSPIRRYPDVMVHRLLTHYLDKGKSENKQKYEELCKQSSNREQIATEAERSSIKYKMTEFMQDKIGNIYPGTISGITEWGIYVEIEPTKVEGMVMLRDIREDFFIFDEKKYCITGKSTGKKFTLGDKVQIKVTKANLEQKLIDYSLIWEPEWNGSGRRPSSDKFDKSRRSNRSNQSNRSENFYGDKKTNNNNPLPDKKSKSPKSQSQKSDEPRGNKKRSR